MGTPGFLLRAQVLPIALQSYSIGSLSHLNPSASLNFQGGIFPVRLLIDKNLAVSVFARPEFLLENLFRRERVRAAVVSEPQPRRTCPPLVSSNCQSTHTHINPSLCSGHHHSSQPSLAAALNQLEKSESTVADRRTGTHTPSGNIGQELRKARFAARPAMCSSLGPLAGCGPQAAPQLTSEGVSCKRGAVPKM